MRKRHKKPSVNVWKPNEADLKEVFTFEGLPTITPDLIKQLIAKGWRPGLFDEIIEAFAPHFEHGIPAFYSERRDSILIPDQLDGVEVTYEITRSEIHLHELSLGAKP